MAGGLRSRAGALRGGSCGDATRGVIKRGQPSSAPHSRERLDTTGVPDEVPGGPRRLPRTVIRSSTEAAPLGRSYQGAPDLCPQGLADDGQGHSPGLRPRGTGAGQAYRGLCELHAADEDRATRTPGEGSGAATACSIVSGDREEKEAGSPR